MKIQYFQEQINLFIDDNPLNRVSSGDVKLERIFDYPLVRVAKVSDLLFVKLKDPEVIGKYHLLPSEWLPGARSVISYFLPFSKKIRVANRVPNWPAPEWLFGRIEGEEFNNSIRQHVVNIITEAGGKAIAPLLDSRYKEINMHSNWSERHAAFIAGLGTFSLSKSLITVKGCAGRYGSIITDLEIASSKRPYTDLEEYCTKCGECIKRCPVKAISSTGKNLEICSLYLDKIIIPRFNPRYGCGKCQTAVPCESTIP